MIFLFKPNQDTFIAPCLSNGTNYPVAQDRKWEVVFYTYFSLASHFTNSFPKYFLIRFFMSIFTFYILPYIYLVSSVSNMTARITFSMILIMSYSHLKVLNGFPLFS
jgi:hypothetical protein